jgi:hypothetical protein
MCSVVKRSGYGEGERPRALAAAALAARAPSHHFGHLLRARRRAGFRWLSQYIN